MTPGVVGSLPESLQDYQPHKDRRHLRLGVTVEGQVLFLERAGFLQKRPGHTETKHKDWLYMPTYQRRAKLAGWLDDQVGAPQRDAAEESDGGMSSMTGHDLADFLRQWLRKEGHEGLSVCDVILKDARFKDLRNHVSVANVFWSHIQLEGYCGQNSLHHGATTKGCMRTTLANMHLIDNYASPALKSLLPPTSQRFHWVDYFCLRQCQQDFQVDAIIALIADIGFPVAGVDNDLPYFSRSFSILELYAAIKGGATLGINQMISSSKKNWPQTLAPAKPDDDCLRKFWIGPPPPETWRIWPQLMPSLRAFQVESMYSMKL